MSLVPRRCCCARTKGDIAGALFYAPTARAARCFTVEQKGGGVGGGERAHRRKRRRGSGPREARGHSRLCKPYRSAHYLAARAVYLIILWCNASARATHKRRSRCTGHGAIRMHMHVHTHTCGYSCAKPVSRQVRARATGRKRRRILREG